MDISESTLSVANSIIKNPFVKALLAFAAVGAGIAGIFSAVGSYNQNKLTKLDIKMRTIELAKAEAE